VHRAKADNCHRELIQDSAATQTIDGINRSALEIELEYSVLLK
jgi:hypothetical protein